MQNTAIFKILAALSSVQAGHAGLHIRSMWGAGLPSSPDVAEKFTLLYNQIPISWVDHLCVSSIERDQWWARVWRVWDR